jgi:hypothetical protein
MIADNTGPAGSMKIIPKEEILKTFEDMQKNITNVDMQQAQKYAKEAYNSGKITKVQYEAIITALLPIIIIL